jgi:hypothetical protein
MIVSPVLRNRFPSTIERFAAVRKDMGGNGAWKKSGLAKLAQLTSTKTKASANDVLIKLLHSLYLMTVSAPMDFLGMGTSVSIALYKI